MGFLIRLACAGLAALALLTTASAGVNTPQSGWYSGNPLLGPNSLRDLACSGSTCYASGEFGTLLKSTNNGSSWTGVVTGLTLDLLRVRLAGGSPDRVVVGGGCALRRSDDGGNTFMRLPFTARDTGCVSGLTSFSFPAAKTGYLVLMDGRVLATADGGLSFSRRTPAPGGASDILCVADRTCITVSISGLIERTTDGGVSWTEVANTHRALNAITEADSTTLYAVGPGSAVYKSADAGNTWFQESVPAPSSNLTAIGCRDALNCLIVEQYPNDLVRTVDGGTSWSRVVPSPDATYAVAFADMGRALAVGALGGAEISGDSGASWDTVGGRIAGSFGTLAAASNSVAYAGGSGGVLARTEDGGQTWTNVSPPTDFTVTSLAGVGPNRLFVLASDGTLQRSDNGGGSYSLLNTGRERPVKVLAFDRDRLLLVKLNGISRSTNGGESFQSVGGRAVGHALLTDADPGVGAAVVYGPRRAVLSTDAGAHWHRVGLPRRRTVLDLDFTTPRIGYLLDTNGLLWRTANGGRRWAALPSLGTNGGYALRFSSPRSGYVALRSFGSLRRYGLVLRTTDAGRSWHPQLVSRTPLVDLASGGLATSGGADYALAGVSSLYATDVGGDVGSIRRLAISAKPRSLVRPGRIVLTGRLSAARGGEEIVLSSLVGGRWTSRILVAASNGSFTTRMSVRRTSVFVAQVLGDADHTGAGTPPLTVRVG